MEYEDWVGCDIGTYCACESPQHAPEATIMEERDGWCKKCNKPIFKASSGGSVYKPVKIPYGRWTNG